MEAKFYEGTQEPWPQVSAVYDRYGDAAAFFERLLRPWRMIWI